MTLHYITKFDASRPKCYNASVVVKVFPFEGILYNKDRLKKVTKVFTPPYDVISPEEQDAFYAVHDPPLQTSPARPDHPA